MNKQEWQDLLAVYALGDATQEETAAVTSLVAENPEAAAYLAEVEATVGAIPFMVEPMPVSEEATTAVMVRVEATIAPAPAPVSQPQPARPATAAASAKSGWWQQLQALWQQPAFAATAVALAAIILVWALNLQQQVQMLDDELVTAREGTAATATALTAENEALTTNNEQLAAQLDVLQRENASLTDEVATLSDEVTTLQDERDVTATDLAALETMVGEMETAVAENQVMQAFFDSPNLYTVTLAGTEAYPEAEAQLVVDPESQLAMLVVVGLEPLPQDNVYQVLLIRGTEHETAETFRVSTEGGGVLLVRSEEPIESFDSVGVSIEPEGGSVQRTGALVVVGDVFN